jgi:NADH dehydrogenase
MIISEMTTSQQHKPHVLVIGGGFGGVRAARRLARHHEIDVTLVSSTPSFAYYPQLYHAATGGARLESSLPLSDLFAGTRVHVVTDTATVLDPAARTVTGASGQTYAYDHLVLALGSVTNYFGIKGLDQYAYDIKTIDGAEKFKRHLHDILVVDKKPDLNYVVVGGGPTGVELSAALVEYLRRIMRQHHISAPNLSVDLVEASPRILPRSPEAFAARIHRQLESLGIKVLTGATVEAETATQLKLKGDSLASRTVVWTAGVSNNPFYAANEGHFTLAKNHKVQVDQYLQARPNVYVIGDNAATEFSGMAQTAITDADFVAANIYRSVQRRPLKTYKPQQPISVVPVGNHWAAALWGGVKIYGLVGHVLRRFADLIAYADIESIPRALRVWLREYSHEDRCDICDKHAKHTPDAPSASKNVKTS